jgi:disulfide bond formation protein DsbB
MMIPRLRLTLAAAAVLAAAVLFAAHASEVWGGLIPCALCLVERWPYRIAIFWGVVGLVLPRFLARIAAGLLVLTMLGGTAAGFVHVGVEQGFWPSPLPECRGVDLTGMTMAQRLAAMPARPSKPCDEPSYLIPFIPVSLAALNMLISFGIAGGVAGFLWVSRRDPA